MELGSLWRLWVLLMWVTCLVRARRPRLPTCCERDVASSSGLNDAVAAMLTAGERVGSSVFAITDGTDSAFYTIKDIIASESANGLGVFEGGTFGLDGNVTYQRINKVVTDALQLRKDLSYVTVVVASDDPDFLTAFAESTFRNRLLLVETTRLLVLTRLPLHTLLSLHHIHKTFSKTDSLLAIIQDEALPLRVDTYSLTPYSQTEDPPIKVASWTQHLGLTLTSRHGLFFPPKFYRFPHRPHIQVTVEELPAQKAVMVDDPTAPGGKRLTFRGAMDDVMGVVSSHMNLTYSYLRSRDRTWGSLKPDGSWTGMMGLLTQEKVEMALGPFGMTPTRNADMEFTQYMTLIGYRIYAARGRPEVDPWGFLLPLSPLVWVAVLTALLGVVTVMLILPSCCPQHNQRIDRRVQNGFTCLRVLLQQDVEDGSRWRMWERVVVGVWMLMMLVMTKSYAGNLMSLLAVRYISQPYQSLRDVLDDPSVSLIIQKDNANTQYYSSVKTGIFREVGNLLGTDRIIRKLFAEFADSADKLVRPGRSILFDAEFNLINMMAQDFSKTARCDFYYSRNGYLSYILAMLGQKNSPIIPGVNRVVASLVENGVYEKWLRFSLANSTSCLDPPTTITVTTILSLGNLWGMFVVLVGGLALGLMVLLLEILVGQNDTTPTHRQ